MKKIIAGVDEAGRGSLIGPVYAAAVILKKNINKKSLKDSKKISEHKTLVINQQEFQFHGIMKMIAFFEPTGFNAESFKIQTKIYLEAFKDFVESQKHDNANIDA